MVKDTLLEAIDQNFDKVIVIGMRITDKDREALFATASGLSTTEVIGSLERIKSVICNDEQQKADKEKVK